MRKTFLFYIFLILIFILNCAVQINRDDFIKVTISTKKIERQFYIEAENTKNPDGNYYKKYYIGE